MRVLIPAYSFLGLLWLLTFPEATFAAPRDAAFMESGMGSSGTSDDAMKVEPKSEIDSGDTIIGVARRTGIFFVNQTSLPIKIEKININNDGNVAAELSNDDCSKQGTIAPQSRCSIEVSVTPTSPGAWGVDVLMTHNGPGRIVRAKITGKTSGSTATDDKKERGLALSTKETSPINFGDVEIGGGKAVRSALMTNDSAEPITIYSIDIIEAENGLQRLDQGCVVDMELKPGESCPVTMVWSPTSHGAISTDLIIRHSGRLGFAVVQIRGNAKSTGTGESPKNASDSVGSSALDHLKPSHTIAPPSMADLERAVSLPTPSPVSSHTSSGGGVKNSLELHLIGTVGNRAIILKSDNTTAIVTSGESFEIDGAKVPVTILSAHTVEVTLNGKKKTLTLEASSDLISKASEQTRANTNSASPGFSQAASAPAATSTQPAATASGSSLSATGSTSSTGSAAPAVPSSTSSSGPASSLGLGDGK